MGAESVTVCFTGNPNCGKTTLFNAYTGAGKKTANWPGVTVALSEGSLMHRGRLVHLVDTPGIYSLDPYTMEETVTRQCIRDQKADVIIHVADALLLERSLFLTMQLLAEGRPMVLALNMMDLVRERGMDIDTEGLLLITNDGALAHDLLSPAKHVSKVYYAKIDGRVTEEDVNLFENGVNIGEEKPAKPALLEVLHSGDNSEIRLTITEGRFHQVKRMFEAVGKKVTYLKRVEMGSLVLPDELAPGEYRPLTEKELQELRRH